MNTDRSLSVFAGQFVPLKLTTDGNAQWSSWTRKYPAEGRGIPYLYVVRADGEKLYAKSGALPGPALPQMLTATLQQSGRTFNDAEVALLEQSLTKAKEAIAAEDHFAAATALGDLQKLGTPGELNSYSKLAKEADSLVEEIKTAAEARIAAAQEQLNDPQTAFDGALALAEGEEAYASYPDLNAKVIAAMREVKRNSDADGALKQAEGLVRARKFAASENALVNKKAPDAYELVIKRFPNTPGAQLAREELAAIDPDAEILSADLPAAGNDDGYRTWSDPSGKFEIEAQYVQQKQGFVQLKKRDGSLLAVPISKLSAADQQYLEGR